MRGKIILIVILIGIISLSLFYYMNLPSKWNPTGHFVYPYLEDFPKNIGSYTELISDINLKSPCEGSLAVSRDLIVWTGRKNDSETGKETLNLYLFNASSHKTRKITDDNNKQDSASISGNFIVWRNLKDGESDIYVYDIKEKNKRQITFKNSGQGQPDIYENKVVWVDHRHSSFPKGINNPDIYFHDLEKGITKQITTNDKIQTTPAIYGNIVVWSDWRDDKTEDNMEIYYYNLETEERKRLTSTPYKETSPDIFWNTVVWNGVNNSIQGQNLKTGEKFNLTPLTRTRGVSRTEPSIHGNKVIWAEVETDRPNFSEVKNKLGIKAKREDMSEEEKRKVNEKMRELTTTISEIHIYDLETKKELIRKLPEGIRINSIDMSDELITFLDMNKKRIFAYK